MPHNKYELRNSDVQKIMRKPPHAFIARGNILILLLLFVAFYFLNKFPLYEKETTHFEIANIYTGTDLKGSVKIVLLLNNGISKNVKQNQAAKLFINNMKFNGRVDSIGYTPYKAPVIYFKGSQSGTMLQQGMIGYMEIIIREKTFLSMLLDRFKI